MELFAAHRRPLDHRPLVAGELFEPRGQQRLDRRRHPQVDQWSGRHPSVAFASQRTVIDQHREHLLDEQRCALGRGEDPIARLLRERRATEQVPDQVAALIVGERLEGDRRGVELAPAPARPLVQQLRPRDAEHQDRGLPRPAGDVFDQVQERGLAPVDVVEHDGERCRLGDRLQERPDRPERLLDRAVAFGRGEELRERRARRAVRPEHRADLPLDLVRCVEVIQAGRLLHDLAHGEERDPLAVREAAASKDRGLSERTEELLDQPGLADPRRAEDREQLTRAVGDRGLERLPEPRELTLPADHGRIQAPRDPGDPGRHLDQTERGERLRLAFDLERRDRLGDHGVPDEAERLLADEDGPRLRGLLQAGGDVHGVAGDERVAVVTGDDLAGVHPDPGGEGDAVVALQLLVEDLEGLSHLRPRREPPGGHRPRGSPGPRTPPSPRPR